MKHSLCIGLNHLDPRAYGGFEGELVNCERDAVAMTMLAARYGYVAAAQLSAQAPRAEVRSALEKLNRIAVPKDDVLIHYSGHGGKVWSEFEADRYDETLCLFDGQITDNEFMQRLGQFKAGVNVVVILDCCYADGLQRSGGDGRAAPGGLSQRDKPHPRAVPLLILKHLPRTERLGLARAPRANTLLFCACSEDETASDGFGDFGAWTGALIDSWSEATPPSWLVWFNSAKQLCAGQTPQLRAFNSNELLNRTALA